MKRPEAAGRVLDALAPLKKTLTEIEERALRGESMSVVELASKLSSAFVEVARHATEIVLDQAARTQSGPVICGCGQQAASTGFEKTHYIGRFGEIAVERRRYACCCGRSFFPFDVAWQLPTGEYSDDVREAAERLSTRTTFEEGVADLEHLWGVAPDASTVERWVRKDGARAAAMAREDARRSWERYDEGVNAVARGDRRQPPRNDGFGVIELDGVHALTWKPGQEPRRRPNKSETPVTATPTTSAATTAIASETSENSIRHQAPSTLSQVQGSPMGPTGRSPRVQGREVCVGLVYCGDDACEEHPGRGVLLDRRYIATLNDRDGFWLGVHAAAIAHGVLDREKLVRVTDGGAYFIERSADLFCDQPLVGIIDCQHVKQHVWETGHKLSADKVEVDQWVLPRTDAIMNGKVKTVIEGLVEDRHRYSKERKIDAIDSLTGYLDRHKHMMDYPTYKAAGYPIASGAIESANKRLVGRRCKQGGMIWSEPGLEAMVAMRVALMNRDAWHSLWPHTNVPDA